MFEIYHYKRPYKKLIQLKQGRFAHREGLLLKKTTDQAIFYGEVSPFPGLQSETLDDCLKQLQEVRSANRRISSALNNENILPSVAWGLQQLQTPVALSKSQKIPLNALLTGQDPSALMNNAKHLYQEGYRCFKIKVGLQAFAQDLNNIQQLLTSYPDLLLRLDANRGWEFQDFLNFSNAVAPASIDYFEEPFKYAGDYKKLSVNKWKKIALDESLAVKGLSFSALSAGAYVLKPMVIGPKRTFELLKIAKENMIRPVISSCFESSVGLAHLVKIAFEHAPNTPCGLDTWRAFSENVCKPELKAKKAFINFDHVFFTAQRQYQLKWNTLYLRKII